jgi:hypothetical protein
MRGTLHLVAAEDLPWMLDVAAPRAVARAAARRVQLDLTGQCSNRLARWPWRR